MKGAANPWSKFFWNDWENDPGLRLCSFAAQGLWMRCLCIMAKANPTGFLVVGGRPLSNTDLARLTGAPEAEVEALMTELDRNGVYSRDSKKRIYNRRMIRDQQKARTNRENGKQGGNPELCKSTTKTQPDNPPDKGPVKPQKPEANSHEPSAREVFKKTFHNLVSRNGSANGMGDKAAKKARWQSNVIAFLHETRSTDEVQRVLQGYMENQKWAVAEFERASDQMYAARAKLKGTA